MNSQLTEAVAIFKALGWEKATFENVMTLPLGTAEQQKIALAGLKSGQWGEYVRDENEYPGRWQTYIDVEGDKLALFAIRVGVNPKRAMEILGWHDYGARLDEAVAGRGAAYVSEFIRVVSDPRRRFSEHAALRFGDTTVRLVITLGLDIPQNLEYLKDWAAYAAAAFGIKTQAWTDEKDLVGLDLIERRFAEHIRLGVEMKAPATGPFGRIFPQGVKRGWMPGPEAVKLIFSALDVAVRPGDRKAWLNALDEIGVSNDELGARGESLIPLLSSGDSVVVARLAPTLIERADISLLSELLLACLPTPTKKARQLVLKAALTRPRPENAQDLAEWLSVLAGDQDKSVASPAAQLIQHWGLNVPATPAEQAEVRGLWQKTPPLWQPPAFELGEISPQALTDLAAALMKRPFVVYDAIDEHFLALAAAVAYRDPKAARQSLCALPRTGSLLSDISDWVNREKPSSEYTKYLLSARDYIIAANLGKLPLILSTPSSVDLSVTVPDLAARLAVYMKTGTAALEADLLLALTRLDIETRTPEAELALKNLDVPVALRSGKKMARSAGELILAYLNDPIKEPPLSVSEYDSWWARHLPLPHSLKDFPKRIGKYVNNDLAVFPHWGDPVLGGVKWDSEVYHEQGLILRQAARRARPLPPGASINMLAAQRSMPPDAAEDSRLAVREAWERGLLRPDVADIKYLDWRVNTPPANVAALTRALEDIASDGMLSVVWPIADTLILRSLQEPRMLAGTAELAEFTLNFLPEVFQAVETRLANEEALALPGIRALAARAGSSKAASAARKVVEQLPPLSAAPVGANSAPLG